MNILTVSLSLLALMAVVMGDKPAPEYNNNNAVGSVSKVSPSSSNTKYAQSKQDTYGAPQAAPVVDSYGAPKAPAQDSYGAPQATPIAAAAPAAPAATPGDVGTQGYYYYYYPVSNNVAAGSTSHHTSTSYEPANTGPDLASAGLLGLLGGKAVVAAVVIGGLIVLAILGTTGINLQGRSLTDLPDYLYENMDEITNFVMNAVDVYQELNTTQ
jgi:hypothetical protein